MNSGFIQTFVGLILRGLTAHDALLYQTIEAVFKTGVLTCAAIARTTDTVKSVAGRYTAVRRLFLDLADSKHVGKRLAALLLQNMDGRRVVVATDMSAVSDGHIITTVLVTSRRCVPLLHTMVPPERDLVEAETTHFTDLDDVLPEGIEYVVLADRAYGHSRLVRQLKSLGFRFVLRCKAQFTIRCPKKGGWYRLDHLRYGQSSLQDFGFVEFSKTDSVRVRVVRYWDRQHNEPLHLITDLEAPACTIAKLYSYRFKIEGFFRDAKDPRYGFSIGTKCLEDFKVLEGMLGAFSCLYLILEVAGLHVVKRGWETRYTSRKARRLTRWRLGLAWINDEARPGSVHEKHLIAQLPNVVLKTGHWDWQPRSHEVDTDWQTLPGLEETKKAKTRSAKRKTERPCDKKLRKRIAERLKKSKATSGDLARAVNRKPTIICTILAGRRPLPECLVEPVATFFGLTRDEMLKGLAWQRPVAGAQKAGTRKAVK